MKIDGIDFDQAWAQKHTEAEFLKVHQHHKDDTNLKAAYAELKKKPKKPKPEAV